MNFSDTEGIYTHTFEAERNVRTSYCVDVYSRVCVLCMQLKNYSLFQHFVLHSM